MPQTKTAKIRVPSPDAERPKLGQVGAIAVVCFAVGVIWPTLAGVKLVPSVPGSEEPTSEPKAKPKPLKQDVNQLPSPEVPVAAAAALEPEKPPSAAGPTVTIDKTLVVNCRDAEERKLASCDQPGFTAVAENRLKALAACEAAKDASGLLSIGFELDFSKLKILKISQGKSSTVDAETGAALVECAKREFMSATLKDVQHTHAHYLVFYMLKFAPAGSAAPEDLQDPVVEASGSATVIWNSARVRTSPEDGKLKARLLYGTRVVVIARQADWYKIRYDARGNEGWVHKNALAM